MTISVNGFDKETPIPKNYSVQSTRYEVRTLSNQCYLLNKVYIVLRSGVARGGAMAPPQTFGKCIFSAINFG